MSATLDFFGSLLRQAKRHQQAGQPASASAALAKLLAYPDLPAESAAEAHARAGELHLAARRYVKARKHLRAALRIAPDAARLHHRLGAALANDPRGDDALALRHYRRALALAPGRTRWRGEVGLFLVRLGRADDGLAQLRQAHDQAPDDLDALLRLARGLALAARPDDALRLVRNARFGSPRCPRLQKAEAQLLLNRLRRERDQGIADRRRDEPAVLLRFTPPALPRVNDPRPDGPHTLPGPHMLPVRARARMT